MKNKFYLVAIAALVLLAHNADCAPVISSASVQDGVISINGNGLGSKAAPSPLSFINAESGSVGAALSDSAYYQSDPGRYTYANNDYHGGSKSVYTTIEDWPDGASLYYDYGVSGTDMVYMTFWVKMGVYGAYLTSGPCQIKYLSVRTQTTAGTPPDCGYGYYPWFTVGESGFAYQNWECSVNYNGAYGTYKLPYPCNAPCVPYENWDFVYLDPKPEYNEWHRVEWYGKRSSSPNVADGSWKTLIMQPGNGIFITHDRDGNAITHASIDELWRYAGFRNEITNSDEGIDEALSLWIDDIYIDNTTARVEIGSGSVFENCDHREIQPATAWSPTGITANLNQGSFPPGNYWIFVVDENGVASAGYPITIGEAQAYDIPTVNAGTDQTVYAASAELAGTYTVDPALSVSLCTWEHDNGSGLCVAALGLITGTVTGLVAGGNTVTVELTDSESQIASDTVVFTRQALPKKAEFHGYGSIKNATIHQ